MKRVYYFIIAVAAAGTLVAAEQPGATQQEPQKTSGLLHEKGFIKRGNEVFRVERITGATKVEGLQVDEQGRILKDGKPIELKEGQMLTPQGEVTKSPLQ